MLSSEPLPTVAICLSNYNGQQYLRTSLEGICSQTHPADEIIVLDDGSTDNSLGIINEYAENCPNMKVLVNETNKGVLFSINRILHQTKSDYIVWAASDDFLLPEFLEISLQALKQFPGAGICFSRFSVFIDGTNQKRIYSKDIMGDAFDLGYFPHFLTPIRFYERLKRSYLWISGNTVLARRDALLEMGGFPSSLRWHADWFAFFIVAMRYGACVVPETLTFMREAAESYSRDGIKNRKVHANVLRAILSLAKKKEFSDVAHFFDELPYLFTPFGWKILFVMLKEKKIQLALKYWRLHLFIVLRGKYFPFLRKCVFRPQYAFRGLMALFGRRFSRINSLIFRVLRKVKNHIISAKMSSRVAR